MSNGIPRKRLQHYVPKFYLRNFSLQNGQGQIGIFNTENGFFHPEAKLKTQASRDFYYGQDGKVEGHFAELENLFSRSVNKIARNERFDLDGDDHELLLLFTVLTEARNPVHLEVNLQGMFRSMRGTILEESPNTDIDSLLPELKHEEALKIGLANFLQIVEFSKDLSWKILDNHSGLAFLTSDHPVVRYNQYLEDRAWALSKCGWGVLGIQVIVPLSPKRMLIFYDPKVYDFGRQQKRIFEIRKQEDVHQLNILQFLNCNKMIFFNEEIDLEYLKRLLEESKGFVKANMPFSTMEYMVEEDTPLNDGKVPERKNLLVTGTTECQINLSITGLKIKSSWRYKPLPNRAVIPRKKLFY